MRRRAAPDRGDIVWLSVSPQVGREQAGRPPALVRTPAPFNDRVGLAFVCPITSRVKGYPFEVALAGVRGIAGVVLVDQLRSLDWRARLAEQAGRAPPPSWRRCWPRCVRWSARKWGRALCAIAPIAS